MIARAVLCLVTCIVAWISILCTMYKVNPMLKKHRVPYALAVIGFLAVVVTLATSCKPATYAEQQAAERPPCRDVALGVIVAECTAKIKATPNATEKNRMRAACLEEINVWEQCQ